MSIEIVWPTTIRPASAKFDIATRTVFSSSALRRSRTAFGSVIQQWTAELSFENLPPDLWARIDGLRSGLDGPLGVIRMWHPVRYLPLGMAAGLNMSTVFALGNGSPFSDGTYFSDGKGFLDASAWGTVATSLDIGSEYVTLGGLVASQPLSIAAGDLFEIGGYLYRAVQDAASDASGKSSIMIRPRLRTRVLAGDPVKFAYPTSPFQLADDSQGAVEMTPPDFGGLGLSLVEIIP